MISHPKFTLMCLGFVVMGLAKVLEAHWLGICGLLMLVVPVLLGIWNLIRDN